MAADWKSLALELATMLKGYWDAEYNMECTHATYDETAELLNKIEDATKE